MKGKILCILFIFYLLSGLNLKVNAEYTDNETSFLKSLNGKWNPTADYDKKWNSWALDITLKYINGKVKISYPALLDKMELKEDFVPVEVKVI